MKTFSAAKNKVIDRNSAKALAAINVLVTPGLGTIMSGRIFVGIFQLLAAVGGFLLLLKWLYSLVQSAVSGTPVPSWEWQIGLALFSIGWIGSAWSSLNLVRTAASQTPPKLDGSAG
jgi:hypothetical protein